MNEKYYPYQIYKLNRKIDNFLILFFFFERIFINIKELIK